MSADFIELTYDEYRSLQLELLANPSKGEKKTFHRRKTKAIYDVVKAVKELDI